MPLLVKQEAFKEAGDLLSTRVTGDPKKNYVSSLHNVVFDGKKLTIKSTDQISTWIFLDLLVEDGQTEPFTMWLDAITSNGVWKQLKGGRVDVERDGNGELWIHKDKMSVTLAPQISPGDVKDKTEEFKNAVFAKKVPTKVFKQAIDWIREGINSEATDMTQQVATFYEGNTAIAWNDSQFVKASGLGIGKDWSFTQQTASTLSSWLGRIQSSVVSISFTDRYMIVKEDASENLLALLKEDNKAKDIMEGVNVKDVADECIIVDRDWLTEKLGLLQATLRTDSYTVKFTISGKPTPDQSEIAFPATLAIASTGTMGKASDSLPVVRKRSGKDMVFGLDVGHLLKSVRRMETPNIKLYFHKETGLVMLEQQIDPSAEPVLDKVSMLKTRIIRDVSVSDDNGSKSTTDTDNEEAGNEVSGAEGSVTETEETV